MHIPLVRTSFQESASFFHAIAKDGAALLPELNGNTFKPGASLQERAKLRHIKAADFEEALKEVVPTVSPESMVIEELKQWAAKYGEGGNRSTHNNSLTYFI